MTKPGLPGLSGQQVNVLLANLNPKRVAQRVTPGSRQQMSYLEAWDVKSKLIAVFGFGNFDAGVIGQPTILNWEDFEEQEFDWTGPQGSRTKTLKVDKDGNPVMKRQFRITAMVTYEIVIHATGARYTESAVASQKGSDPGEVADFAVKTAESDALKRCATYLGSQFGLSLYASDSNHVHYDDVVRTVFDPVQSADLARAIAEADAQRQSEPSGAPSGPTVSPDPIDAADEAAAAALAKGFDHPDARKS